MLSVYTCVKFTDYQGKYVLMLLYVLAKLIQ